MKGKYIALIVISIIVVCIVIAGGVFSINKNSNKLSVLNQYNLTENEYDNLKNLANKMTNELEKQNLELVELYYSKVGGILVAKGVSASNNNYHKSNEPIDISAGTLTYVISTDNGIKIYDKNDKLELLGTAGEYYGEGFKNAMKDTEYKECIYFRTLENLKSII